MKSNSFILILLLGDDVTITIRSTVFTLKLEKVLLHYASALKRLVEISHHDICWGDEISKNIFLMGSGHQVKFHIDPYTEMFHKNAEWDMLPPIFPKTFCHNIKNLKFSINNDFLLKTVRVSIDCFEHNLNGNDEYRRSAANNCRSQFNF